METTRVPLCVPRAAIDETDIRNLVLAFYSRIRNDSELGPIFEKSVGQRWDQHLSQMIDFWSSVILHSGRYGGKPHVAHRKLGLTAAHFERWLNLFARTAREECSPDAAAHFVDRAHRIADSLQIGLDIGPKALSLLPQGADRADTSS
jgi:hemoglobin